jgi:threonine dehydrogenase-like Zn-dependent dehydrogenase
MTALAAGAQSVYMLEVVPGRRELAAKNIQATVLDPSTTSVPDSVREASEGWGAHVVFECSASPHAFADALAATRKVGFDELIRPNTTHAKIHTRPA